MRYWKYVLICAAGILLCSCGEPLETVASLPETTVSDMQTEAIQTTAAPALTAAEIHAMPAGEILPADALTALPLDDLFTAEPISDSVFARINGISYRDNPYITRDDLRYLRMLHFAPDGSQRIGEMIVNAQIADDILEIFRALYDAQYPIERMVLIDEYGGDDEASMADNNTSSFNYRAVAGTAVLSNHARGLAVDVNPCYNPYITYSADGTQNIAPANAAAFADRSASFTMKIDEQDLCLQLFLEHGFAWGGSWTTSKDYQHFEKTE